MRDFNIHLNLQKTMKLWASFLHGFKKEKQGTRLSITKYYLSSCNIFLSMILSHSFHLQRFKYNCLMVL